MYSMVLLLAMGTSADTPAWGNGGCCGGCYGSAAYWAGGWANNGCCGGMRYGCCGGGCCGGSGSGCCGGMMAPGMAAPGMAPPRNAEPIQPPKASPPGAAAMAPATLLIHLPADASLTINTTATAQMTADTRKFVSPPLEPGRDYYYNLQAEVVQGGQRLVTNSRVFVRAGQQSEVTLTIPGTTLTQR
jgi:uncharacterized protein (TIGR03000 family)